MLSAQLQKSIDQAFILAASKNHEMLLLEHLLLVLTDDEEVLKLLQQLEVDVVELRQQLNHFLDHSILETDPNNQLSFTEWLDKNKHPHPTDPTSQSKLNVIPSHATQRVIRRALFQSQGADQGDVTCTLIFLSILSESDSHAAYMLTKQGVDRLEVMSLLAHGSTRSNSEMEQSDTESKTKSATEFLTNLNEKAMQNKVEPLIGRDWEMQRIMQILCRRSKNNPLLVGDPGVGKTALAEGLASKIVNGEVPRKLMQYEVYLLDLGSMVAGTRYRGDFEKRLKSVIKQVTSKENCVVFIDEIHTLVGAGAAGSGSLDASNLLKPLLASGDVSFMGATTYEEFRTVLSNDKALMRRFQKIDVSEPNVEETIEILQGHKPHLETFHQVKFKPTVLRKTVELAKRYIRDRRAPDSALDIIDEAGARWQAQLTIDHNNNHQKNNAKTADIPLIDDKYIEKLVSDMMRVPIANLNNDEKKKLAKLDTNLKMQIYGQDEAIDSLVSAIKVSRAKLADETKPIGSFLFVGPTGVGKTALCQQMASQLSIKLLRFDMSEYMEPHSVSKLIGAPPGYVGFDKAGLLTEAIQKEPYCLILLDEIEKAHPDVYALLLQIMDYGTLTDSNGRKVNFRNTILVMTSNVGAREAGRNQMGFVDQDHQMDIDTELNRTFTPEFRNRLDSIIRFNSLPHSVMIKIADKSLFALESKLTQQNIYLSISQKAREWLAKNGYDEKLGARPVERLVRQKLYQPIADAIISGAINKGGKVQIKLKENQLNIEFVRSEPQKSNTRSNHRSPKHSPKYQTTS